MSESSHERWDHLLVPFFGSGNRLDWPSNSNEVVDLIQQNTQSVDHSLPGPYVLPRVDEDGQTLYYAVANDDDQAHDLRRLVTGVVGPTYTSYAGRTLESDLGDQVEQALIEFAGSSDRIYPFRSSARRERRNAQFGDRFVCC